MNYENGKPMIKLQIAIKMPHNRQEKLQLMMSLAHNSVMKIFVSYRTYKLQKIIIISFIGPKMMQME